MGTRDRLLFLANNHLRALMDNQALMMRQIQVYLSVDIHDYRDYKKSPIHKLNYRYTRIFDNVVREGMERGYIREGLELSAMRDLFFGGLEYGMRTLIGRKYKQERITTYVEAIVEPLWQSMQAPAAAGNESTTDSRLEASFERLEQIIERLEQVK